MQGRERHRAALRCAAGHTPELADGFAEQIADLLLHGLRQRTPAA